MNIIDKFALYNCNEYRKYINGELPHNVSIGITFPLFSGLWLLFNKKRLLEESK